MKLSIAVNDTRYYNVLSAYDQASESYGYGLDEGPVIRTGFSTTLDAVKSAVEDIFALEGET